MSITRLGRAAFRLIALGLLALAGWSAVQAVDPVTPIVRRGEITRASVTSALFSPRRAPGIIRSRVGAAIAAERLTGPGGLARRHQSCLTVEDANGTVVSYRGDAALVPASTEKILTAAAALRVLGPRHRFTTEVIATTDVAGGRIEGDLVIVGGADPVLATDGFAAQLESSARTRGTDTTPLGRLADAIYNAGVRDIGGSVLADDSQHEATRFLSNVWKDSYTGEVGPLSALALDHGYTNFAARTRAEDPAVYTAAVLTQLLETRGVAVGGEAGRAGIVPTRDAVAAVESPPLRDIVGDMLTSSDNFVAEMLARSVGRAVDGTGTTAAGVAAIPERLAEERVPTKHVKLIDGSGLSPFNRATCNALLGTLELARENKRGTFIAVVGGLADAGETGTLAERFAGSQLQGRLHAKTGQIDGVVGLVGFIDGGLDVRFAFLANGDFDQAGGVALQDDLVNELDEYRALGAEFSVPSP